MREGGVMGLVLYKSLTIYAWGLKCSEVATNHLHNSVERGREIYYSPTRPACGHKVVASV